jgi:hypothetical protein
MSAQAWIVGSDADLWMTIENGCAVSVLSGTGTIVFEEPPVMSLSGKGPFGLTDALGSGLPEAEAEPAALGAALGAMLAAALAPALGPELGTADAMSAQLPDTISAGKGSLKPIAMTPTVTAVLPSPRSLRTAPPVTLLLFTATIGTTSRAAALADGEASGEATELSGELPAVVAAVVGAGVAELPHAANRNAAVAARAASSARRPERCVDRGGLAPAVDRSVLAAVIPNRAGAGKPSLDMASSILGQDHLVVPPCASAHRPVEVALQPLVKLPRSTAPARRGSPVLVRDPPPA